MHQAIWLHYEKIIADLPAAVRSIAAFLNIEVDEKLVAAVAEQCTFEAMKKNPKANCTWIQGSEQCKQSHANHLRVGKAGEWKTVFTAEQDRVYTEYCERRLQGTGLLFDWSE